MDLINFNCLNALAWGTVADWMMVLVASITGFLIWKTFNSQLKVQKDQQLIAKIESRRYKQECLPELVCKCSNQEVKDHGSFVTYEVVLNFSVKNHPCSIISIYGEGVNGFASPIKLSPEIGALNNMQKNDTFEIDCKIERLANNQRMPIMNLIIDLKDVIGNPYRLLVWWSTLNESIGQAPLESNEVFYQ